MPSLLFYGRPGGKALKHRDRSAKRSPPSKKRFWERAAAPSPGGVCATPRWRRSRAPSPTGKRFACTCFRRRCTPSSWSTSFRTSTLRVSSHLSSRDGPWRASTQGRDCGPTGMWTCWWTLPRNPPPAPPSRRFPRKPGPSSTSTCASCAASSLTGGLRNCASAALPRRWEAPGSGCWRPKTTFVLSVCTSSTTAAGGRCGCATWQHWSSRCPKASSGTSASVETLISATPWWPSSAWPRPCWVRDCLLGRR